MNDLNNHWYFPQIFIFFLAFLSSLSISSLSIYLIRHYCVVQSCRILARYKMFYKNNTSSTSLFRPFVHNISEDSKCGRIFRAYFHLLLICFYAGLRNNFSFFRKRHGKKTSLFSKQVGLSATRFHTFCTQKIRYFAPPLKEPASFPTFARNCQRMINVWSKWNLDTMLRALFVKL